MLTLLRTYLNIGECFSGMIFSNVTAVSWVSGSVIQRPPCTGRELVLGCVSWPSWCRPTHPRRRHPILKSDSSNRWVTWV